METIATQRLILRKWSLNDVEDLFEYAKNPDVGPKAGWKPHETLEESESIAKMFIASEQYAIELKENKKVIGSIGWLENQDGSLDIGYALSKDYWGRAYMPEAAKALMDYMFKNLNCSIITVGHFDFNNQSKRVIEKLGFDYKNTNTYIRKYDNKAINKLNYAITKQKFYELNPELKG